jgi:hypothetical protein
VFCQRTEYRADDLLHRYPIEPGVASAHPSPIDTSSVTSPC